MKFQNLTEYNTAHNRRISMLGISDDVKTKKNKNNKRKRRNVTFNDEECIINPEDVDPNVGRFRNLIQTTVVPTKRSRIDNNFMGYSTSTSSSSTSSGLLAFKLNLINQFTRHPLNESLDIRVIRYFYLVCKYVYGRIV